VRPSEVAADTKRNFIPTINHHYAKTSMFPPFSVMFRHPTTDLRVPRRTCSTRPPTFFIEAGDPVWSAISYGQMDSQQSEAAGGPSLRTPFICAANERRPGGDWETGCSGYEEKLCRRSNLSATLGTPCPDSGNPTTNYPIPSDACIMSDKVVVYRGPHERYEMLDRWYDIPVISVPPTRWPKLKENGTKYSFEEERDMIKDKIRGALNVCLHYGYNRVVIGDFGLGNGHRNPPQEVAEIWRDVFLFDPHVRGQFTYVAFVFDDPLQSTARLILDEMMKKESKSKSRHRDSTSSSGSSRSSSSISAPSDMSIFKHIFSPGEIERVLRQPDPRYGLAMITT
jgi:uncharacterized protein (TIGR02452 family)